MKLKINNGTLEIKTTAYQARNGFIFLDWGNTVIRLEKMYAEIIANEIPELDREAYKKAYNIKK